FTLDVEWSAGDGTAVLFGPSGSGKTLTLQCLAGLVRPDRGRVVVNGRTLLDTAAGVDLPPQARRLGYVFQGYALFPHLSVADNLAFGLRGRPRAERQARVREVVARLGLGGLADRYPRELSGGQPQSEPVGAPDGAAVAAGVGGGRARHGDPQHPRRERGEGHRRRHPVPLARPDPRGRQLADPLLPAGAGPGARLLHPARVRAPD